MAPKHEHDPSAEQDEDLGEEFIEDGDVYAEIGDDADAFMDEEDDEVGELASAAGGEDGDEIVWEDTSIQHFPEHRKSVFAVAGHPAAPIAVSGGEDDLGYIWDIRSGETIVKLTGHTDSVACVGFSNDGEMVSTGGMDGRVRVWRRVGKENWKTWEFLTELQGPDEVMVSVFLQQKKPHCGVAGCQRRAALNFACSKSFSFIRSLTQTCSS
jgi:ribosome assembly protein SQT1